ncbi:MAG: hypothetical protein GF344_09930 [Chitinivibrionales bacterium]|nr:hypothetical protein [Chitinivibrionales bacterium]MBD3357155.1 hypothetical protein [Chitinivibrionales bacterium]
MKGIGSRSAQTATTHNYLYGCLFARRKGKKEMGMMNRRTCMIALAGMLLTSWGGLWRTNAETHPLIDSIRAKYDFDKGIELAFELETYWAVREKTRKRKGHVILGPDDRFRAEVDNVVWVCDGRTYWQYNNKTNQVIIKRLLDIDLSMHPSQIIKTYLTEYDFSVKEQDGREAILEGVRVSKENDGRKQTVTLWVDKKKNTIVKAVSVDRQGNRNTYMFTKTRPAAGADPGTFQFEIPEGAEVLDTR